MCVPDGSKPGDRVLTSAFTSRPDDVLNPKKKVWETVAVDLKVGYATYQSSFVSFRFLTRARLSTRTSNCWLKEKVR